MTRMQSRPVTITQVYAQDTQPTDERDGVLWVDTSEPSRPVYAYSSDTVAWEPVAPGNVTVSDTAPTGESEGHIWVDTSAAPPKLKTLDSAGNWVVPKILYSEIEQTPHVENKETAGGSYSESVTWDAAFSAAPVIAGQHMGGGYTDVIMHCASRSTTGATVETTSSGGATRAVVKMVRAEEEASR